ncbi:SWIM-type domain-containing protein [Trichonephila clavipes]|nr:SWIM-type domain-containing protein [Trichonephila clavipes]
MERGKLTSKISTIRTRHQKSYSEMENYSAEQLEPAKWIVCKSIGNAIYTYEINKVNDCDCPIRCVTCNTCIHSFNCNCVDYAVKFTICKHIHYICQKFPYTVENVSNETTLTIDEGSNHLRRGKEAILREKEKSVVCEERAELVYERIRRHMHFINTAASVASTEEMKCLDQCLEDLMKHMGYSEFGSSVRSIENFPANRYIIKQRQKKNSRLLNKQKLNNVT